MLIGGTIIQLLLHLHIQTISVSGAKYVFYFSYTSIYFANAFTHSNRLTHLHIQAITHSKDLHIQTISISGAKIRVLFQLTVISLTVRVGRRWGRGRHS